MIGATTISQDKREEPSRFGESDANNRVTPPSATAAASSRVLVLLAEAPTGRRLFSAYRRGPGDGHLTLIFAWTLQTFQHWGPKSDSVRTLHSSYFCTLIIESTANCK